MTRAEFVAAYKMALANNDVLVIRHKNMKTVEFWVTGEEESVYQKFYGWWISLQTREPIVNDVIKIKKDDLINWEIV